MDQKFRTSFIPKQEVIRTEVRQPTDFRLSIFSIIALGVFGAAAILAVAVFVYQHSLIKSIGKMNADLVAARQAFQPQFVETLIRLDQRLESAKKILAHHNGVGPVLAFLEEETLKDVRYKNLEYVYDSNGNMKISMAGEARNFITIASQSALWSGEHRIVNPIFNNLNVDEKDMAKFTFESSLETPLFLYKNSVMPEESTSTLPINAPIKITPVNNDAGVLPDEDL
ncbi:MAG: hypothetical protein HYV68_00440 [Candidatus Taylorbacteria bacterium]|nr:hypothetical protein [Candidatus Taylorbacteria bacterium]